jgi:hypothetical protein
MQARPAEDRVALDDRGLESELTGADGGHVTAGTAAQHRDIEEFVGGSQAISSF